MKEKIVLYKHKFNENKYKVIDPKGKSYGEFRLKRNADIELKKQEEFFLRFDLKIEAIK